HRRRRRNGGRGAELALHPFESSLAARCSRSRLSLSSHRPPASASAAWLFDHGLTRAAEGPVTDLLGHTSVALNSTTYAPASTPTPAPHLPQPGGESRSGFDFCCGVGH